MIRSIDNSWMKFAAVGLANTLIGLGIIYAAKWFLRFSDLAANLVGYGTGIAFSFVFNKRWTFGHFGNNASAFFRFVAVLLVAYLVNLMTVIGALHLGVNGFIAQALGVAPYAVLSYFGSKHFVFVARGVD
jgi:putative flippase GtrA